MRAKEVVTTIHNYYGTLRTKRLADGKMYVVLEDWDGDGCWGPISEDLAAHLHDLKDLPMVDPMALSGSPPNPSEGDG